MVFEDLSERERACSSKSMELAADERDGVAARLYAHCAMAELSTWVGGTYRKVGSIRRPRYRGAGARSFPRVFTPSPCWPCNTCNTPQHSRD